MDGPRDGHTEWTNSDRQESHITYMWNLKKKNGTDEPIYKTEIESKMWKVSVGGINWETELDICTLLYIK